MWRAVSRSPVSKTCPLPHESCILYDFSLAMYLIRLLIGRPFTFTSKSSKNCYVRHVLAQWKFCNLSLTRSELRITHNCTAPLLPPSWVILWIPVGLMSLFHCTNQPFLSKYSVLYLLYCLCLQYVICILCTSHYPIYHNWFTTVQKCLILKKS